MEVGFNAFSSLESHLKIKMLGIVHCQAGYWLPIVGKPKRDDRHDEASHCYLGHPCSTLFTSSAICIICHPQQDASVQERSTSSSWDEAQWDPAHQAAGR
jgi:hypothetical protein